MVYYVINKY